MKAFEEWDNREYPLPPTIERGPVGRDMLKQRKATWRAALEWVLSKDGGEAPSCWLSDLIEKELSEE